MNVFFEWAIPFLYLASFAGLAYIVIQALRSGAEVYAGEHTLDTARQFEDIFLFIPPARISQVAWGLAAACFIAFFSIAVEWSSFAGLARGAVVGSVMGGLALFTPRIILKILRAQRVRRFNEQLEDALLTMSNALKSGFSITQAFEAVVRDGQNPIAQEFSVMLHQLRIGVRFEDALGNLETRVESEDLSLMVRSIEIARISGGNLTEVFEKIAATIRERLRIEGRIRTLTAQGRLQGIVVGLMPVILGVALMAVDPVMMRSFLSSYFGIAMLLVVGVLELAGGLLIRKIIKIDV